MASGALSLRRVRGFLHEQYRRTFRHDHWNIGIVDAPIQAFLEPDADLAVRWLPSPPPGEYYADPFGLTIDGTTEILFEVFDFRSDRGAISWVREQPDGGFSRPRSVIDLRSHVSYPFLLNRGGSVYCIPETAHNREIALYRAVEFPRKWEKVATLVRELAALDSTVFEWDGMFWLFCTDLDDGPFTKLRVWYARDLLGPWTAHPGNPVKTDIASARPAGTPFFVGGEVYRPAQDSSRTYGGSVVVNRIVRLTTTEFREERVATVQPFRDGPHRQGIHTLASVGARTLVDGKRFAFNRTEMYRHLRQSLGRRRSRTYPVR